MSENMENNNPEENTQEVVNEVKVESSASSKSEAENGKGMAILAYIGILALIPFFAEKNNKFVVFHAKQGMNLLIIEVAAMVISAILSAILTWRLFFLSSLINLAVWVFTFVFSIIGIINACNGETKELPIIGGIKIIK